MYPLPKPFRFDVDVSLAGLEWSSDSLLLAGYSNSSGYLRGTNPDGTLYWYNNVFVDASTDDIDPEDSLYYHKNPNAVVVWNLATRQQQSYFVNDHRVGLKFIPGTYNFVIESGNITLCDAISGQRTLLHTHGSGGDQLPTVNEDGSLVGFSTSHESSNQECIMLMCLRTGEVKQILQKADDGRSLWMPRFLPKGSWIVCNSYVYDYSDFLYYWNLSNGKQFSTQREIGKDFYRILASHTGRWIVAQHEESGKPIEVWETMGLETDKVSWKLSGTLIGQNLSVHQCFFAPDDSLIATVGLEESDEKVTGVGNHAQDNLFATGEPDLMSVRLYDIPSGHEHVCIPLHANIFCECFSADSRFLATLSADTKNNWGAEAPFYYLTIWDIKKFEQVAQIAEPREFKASWQRILPNTMVFSPNGRWIAVKYNTHVEIWDMDEVLAYR